MMSISHKDRVFILTGAGVSAESGTPNFRGMNGQTNARRLFACFQQSASEWELLQPSPKEQQALYPACVFAYTIKGDPRRESEKRVSCKKNLCVT
jgi:NAD-dependent SIR2 family protein deacetylase